MLFPFWNIIRPTSYDAKSKHISKRMTCQPTTRRPPTLLVSSFFSQFTPRERDTTLDNNKIKRISNNLGGRLSPAILPSIPRPTEGHTRVMGMAFPTASAVLEEAPRRYTYELPTGRLQLTQPIFKNPFLNGNNVALGCTHGNPTGKSSWSSCLTPPMVSFYSSPVNCSGGAVRQLDEKEFQSEQLKVLPQVYGTNDEICRRNIYFDDTRQPHPENENMVIYPTLPENHPLHRPLPCGHYHVVCNVTEQEGNWSLYVDDPLFDTPLECGNGKTSYHEVNLPCPRDGAEIGDLMMTLPGTHSGAGTISLS